MAVRKKNVKIYFSESSLIKQNGDITTVKWRLGPM
jgi:hypothetical protein